MTTREQDRVRRLLPNGEPRYIRCYDNGGETIDRYSVVFSGRYSHKTGGEHWALFMSGAPFHPQGVCQHSTGRDIFDAPSGWTTQVGRKCHACPSLGRRIRFADLPADCQRAAMQDYLYLWDLPGGANHPQAVDPFATEPTA